MGNLGVISTIGIIVGSTEAKNLIEKKSLSLRVVIAGFLLGIFLFPLEAANPKLSHQFQVLLVITALLINGQPLLQLLTKISNSTKG